MTDNSLAERKKLALAAYARREWTVALDMFQALCSVAPADREAALAASLLLARAEETGASIERLQVAKTYHPADAVIAARLASLLKHRGEHRAALAALSGLSTQQMNSPPIAGTHIECMIEIKQFDKARALLEDERISLETQERSRLEVKILDRSGDVGGMRSLLESLQAPTMPWHATALGRARLTQGDLSGAMAAFDCAADLCQKHRASRVQREGRLVLTRHRALHERDLCHYLADHSTDFAWHGLQTALDNVIANWDPHAEILVLDGNDMIPLLPLTSIWNRPPTSLPDRAVAHDIDWRKTHAALARDGVAVIDGFLEPAVLAALRRHLVEAAIWFGDGYAKSYLASDLETGLANLPLLRLIDEMRAWTAQAYPDLITSAAWAFKYGANVQGVDPHADFSRLTLNLWLAPDDANLDPHSGGLVFWPVRAPPDSSFYDYNSNHAWLEQLRGGQPAHLCVPHRCNRAILFDSAMLHASDRIAFADQHESRRINLTIAFGYR